MTVNKQIIINQITRKYNLNRDGVHFIFDEIFDIIGDAMRKGDTVVIRGFARFYPKPAAPKKAYIISKQQSIDLPARHVPRAKFSPTITQAIANLPIKNK